MKGTWKIKTEKSVITPEFRSASNTESGKAGKEFGKNE